MEESLGPWIYNRIEEVGNRENNPGVIVLSMGCGGGLNTPTSKEVSLSQCSQVPETSRSHHARSSRSQISASPVIRDGRKGKSLQYGQSPPACPRHSGQPSEDGSRKISLDMGHMRKLEKAEPEDFSLMFKVFPFPPLSIMARAASSKLP